MSTIDIISWLKAKAAATEMAAADLTMLIKSDDSVEKMARSVLKTYFDTLYNLYVHPNHSGDVASVADGAQTIANKQTLSATSPVTISNTPTVIAALAPVIAIPAATNAAAGHATAAHIQAIEANTNKVTNATHSGEVTGATALTITTAAVTLAKMANMATDSFIGRTTVEAGVPEILSKADALAILNVADGADVTSTNETSHADVLVDGDIASEATTIAGTSATSLVSPDGLAYALQRGTMNYVADAEVSDTYVATYVPAVAALVTGMVIHFKANTVNTGACTLNVNGLGAIAIKKRHDTDPANGDIEAGQIVTVVYDGTNFQMQSQVATGPAGDVATDAIWAAKGDLAVGTGADTAAILTAGIDGKYLKAASGEATGLIWAVPAGGGDALVAQPLSQFAATTSLQLAGVISDETGEGALVFATSPALTTPNIGTPSAGTLTNCTGLPTSGVTGIQGQWTQTVGTFTATPASTSTITMTTDLTALIKVAMTLKYVIGGVTYYGRVAAITSILLTVNGAPLGGNVTALYYGGGTISQLTYDATVNVDGTANTTALKTGTVFTITWRKPVSYLVFYDAYQTVHDSGTHGKVTMKVNATEVNTSAGGLEIAANATIYSTVVDIATAAYDINPGENVIIVVTQGTTVDGAGLRVNAVIVTP